MNTETIKKIVFAGHVDHGKSSTIGRLLSDTETISSSVLNEIKQQSLRSAGEFSYAHVTDKLYTERSAGKTIDTARCLLKTKKNYYQLIDVPGHTEFIKNMVSGASRAEQAVLIIDAKEGLRKNSKRHAYLLSFLGIKNCLVCLNKMDLLNYQPQKYQKLRQECTIFFKQLGISPEYFIPISASAGDNIIKHSTNMPWYKGPSLLETLTSKKADHIKNKNILRVPIQDIYQQNNKSIFVGRVARGSLKIGDTVHFYPGQKISKIRSFEVFGAKKPHKVKSGEVIAFTLTKQIKSKPGLLLAGTGAAKPQEGTRIKTLILWMSSKSLDPNKHYTLKIGANKVKTKKIFLERILDIATLNSPQKKVLKKYQAAECTIHLSKKIAYDTKDTSIDTSRFVLINNHEIAGGGIILK